MDQTAQRGVHRPRPNRPRRSCGSYCPGRTIANRNAVDATPITAVAAHPITVQRPEIRNLPMMAVLVLKSIRSAMTGTATIPFNAAAHINAPPGGVDGVVNEA